MKTLLYEIRYYLAATVLVLLFVPDHQKAPLTQESNTTTKPISTIHKNKFEDPVYLKIGSDKKLDVEHSLLLEEEKKNEIGKRINGLFPEPNSY